MPFPGPSTFPGSNVFPGLSDVVTRPGAEIPHFAFPFQRSGASVLVVEQDTPEHITACENVIVRCPLGFRNERPEFGWPFPEFMVLPLDVGPLTEALQRFEPRGKTDARQYADAAESAVQHVQLTIEA